MSKRLLEPESITLYNLKEGHLTPIEIQISIRKISQGYSTLTNIPEFDKSVNYGMGSSGHYILTPWEHVEGHRKSIQLHGVTTKECAEKEAEKHLRKILQDSI